MKITVQKKATCLQKEKKIKKTKKAKCIEFGRYDLITLKKEICNALVNKTKHFHIHYIDLCNTYADN